MIERIDNRTEQELIKEAIQVQDACNLSGVVHSFSRAMSRLWAITHADGGENKGTEWVNTHRVARLYASKIQSLSGDVKLHDFDESCLENN
jgi:hypothetical protein